MKENRSFSWTYLLLLTSINVLADRNTGFVQLVPTASYCWLQT